MNNQAIKSVTYCIDTNLIVEFIALADIPWKELAQNVDVVRVIIPTKVGEEMDEHKNKSGRLRRRAIDFGKLSRRMEESSVGLVILRETSPRVTVEFGPLFRKSDLDADQFELDDSDNRIVAEAFAIAGNTPGVVFLSDDSKPLRLARQVGLTCARPLADWRRKEGPDERDDEIASLKRELGAQPNLTALIVGTNEQNKIIIEDGPTSTDPACVNAFIEAIEESRPQASREDLKKRYGYYSPDRFDLMSQFGRAPSLTDLQLDQYRKDYSRFMLNSEKIAETLHKALGGYGFSLHIKIAAGNDGNRAGEKVLVEAKIDGPFQFLPTDIISEPLERLLAAPKHPKPQSGLGSLPYLGPNPKDLMSPPRIDIFRGVDLPNAAAQSKRLSWRCEEFRQGDYFEFPVLVVSEEPNAGGLLTVTVSSAMRAENIVVAAAVTTSTIGLPAGPSYFIQRLQHIPKAYRESFEKKLAAIIAVTGR